MMNSIDWDKQSIDEWNGLGFYYEYHDYLKQWRIYGSKSGLRRLPEILISYSNDPANNEISEHAHLGPYNYLKILTWNEPVITEKYIGGSLSDLVVLSEIISHKIESTSVGQIFKVSNEYSGKNTASIVFLVMADGFKPSSIEFSKL